MIPEKKKRNYTREDIERRQEVTILAIKFWNKDTGYLFLEMQPNADNHSGSGQTLAIIMMNDNTTTTVEVGLNKERCPPQGPVGSTGKG